MRWTESRRRCELLKDARDARERLTEVSVILANHRRQYAAINSELRAAGVEVGKLDALESQDATVVHDLEAVIRSLDRIAPVASRSQLVDDAKASRAGIVQFLNSRKSSLNNLVARRPVTKAEIESVTKSLEASIEQVQQACQRSVAGYQAHLLKLPASADASVRESAEKALSEAQAQVHRVGHEIARLRSESLKVHERIGRADAGVAELGPLQHAADRLGQEIENWELASQALGRDGPSLSRLTTLDLELRKSQMTFWASATEDGFRCALKRNELCALVLCAKDLRSWSRRRRW